MSPSVSILMSVRNEEKFLPDALSSLLEQTFSDFEIILVDDASTDRTPDLIEAFARRDRRIRPQRNPSRLGLTASLNRALAASSGSLIARLDGDDIAEAGRIERQVAFMASHRDVVLTGTGVTLIDSDGNTQREFPEGLERHAFRWTTLAHSPIVHSTAMFRAQTAKDLGGYNPEFVVAQDFDLWRRLLRQGDGVCIPGVGAYHRVHDRSVSARRLDAQLHAIEEIAFANLLSEPSFCAAVGDVSRYRTFLAALHRGVNVASRSEETRRMLDALIDAFSARYGVEAQARHELQSIAQTWIDAAMRNYPDTANESVDT